jgi:unsaturated rhamnogalacturonyl hydrolase
MKQPANLFQAISFRLLIATLPLLLALGNGCATHAANSTSTSMSPESSGGITDAGIRDVLNRVARHQLHPLNDGEYPEVDSIQGAKAARPPEGIAWNYPWGVDLFGMERFTDVAGDKDVGNFVVRQNLICARYYAWLAGLEKKFGNEGENFGSGTSIKGLIVLGKLDNCGAMGNEILESMMRHPGRVTPDEKALVARITDWVVNQQDRLPDGTLWRSNVMGGTVWPDDLYMGGVFLVRYGIYTGDQKYIDDAASNIIHQAALEQDADGLWYHGYFVSEKKHAPFKWGRGNGWVMVTLVETLSAMPENDPLRPPLLDILRKQIEGIKKVQASDGMWRQVLDKPELWEETSCTAMFAYSIARAVHRGWIDPSNMAVAREAFAGVSRHVMPDGTVVGTCEGTGIGESLDFYIQRKQPVDDFHGRGPVLLAGTEILMAGNSRK